MVLYYRSSAAKATILLTTPRSFLNFTLILFSLWKYLKIAFPKGSFQKINWNIKIIIIIIVLRFCAVSIWDEIRVNPKKYQMGYEANESTCLYSGLCFIKYILSQLKHKHISNNWSPLATVIAILLKCLVL